MTLLTEQSATHTLARRAFTPSTPGLVGAAVDLHGEVRSRQLLRHGFLAPASSPGVATVSGPPSPGLASCLGRMAEDLDQAAAGPLSAGPVSAGPSSVEPGIAYAGIRVGVEAGLDGGGVSGIRHRWRLAHTLAPVLAAAFANSPLDQGRPSGWRSLRHASRKDSPVVPAGDDPRAAWIGYVLDVPAASGVSFRAWLRSDTPPSRADLEAHLAALTPPVAARGYLELDFADRQEGDAWRVAVAVTAVLIDDPVAARAATAATRHLAFGRQVWERAARDALTDPELAEAARECFLNAYGALARQGADRSLRDAVATYLERYVLRGRTPADDVLDRVGVITPGPRAAGQGLG